MENNRPSSRASRRAFLGSIGRTIRRSKSLVGIGGRANNKSSDDERSSRRGEEDSDSGLGTLGRNDCSPKSLPPVHPGSRAATLRHHHHHRLHLVPKWASLKSIFHSSQRNSNAGGSSKEEEGIEDIFPPPPPPPSLEKEKETLKKDPTATGHLESPSSGKVDKNPRKKKKNVVQTPYREYLYKVLLIGDPGVGKTSFVQRYTNNIFRTDYKGTVGVDFALKVLRLGNNCRVKLQLWDIAGQERFTWMTRVYYRGSSGCIVMLDLGERSSVAGAARWKADLDDKCRRPDGSKLPCLLLANKCDLRERQVSLEEVDEFHRQHDFIGWTETSAKDDTMVRDSVKFLVDTMLKQEREEEEKLNKIEVEHKSVLDDQVVETEETIKIKDIVQNQQSSSICWYC